MAHPALPDKAALLAQVQPSREKWGPRPPEVIPEPIGPGEESVWDYPRPPAVRPAPGPVKVIAGGRTLAETHRALEVIETAGAPVPYIPPEDVAMDALRPADRLSICEWKGAAVYYDLVLEGEIRARAAFAYPDPLDDLGQGYGRIAGWIAFYVASVDEAWMDGRRAEPQPGGLYAGWATERIKGPIKGGPGTSHW